MVAGLVTLRPDGVRVSLKVTPKAARSAITGTQATADGGQVLKVAVTEAAADGRANEAVVRLLAKAWDVARSDIAIVSGQTQRLKTLAVSGEVEGLRARILASAGLTEAPP